MELKPYPDVFVATACSSGASQTMVTGLRAAGIKAEPVDEAQPKYADKKFAHPGMLALEQPNSTLLPRGPTALTALAA